MVVLDVIWAETYPTLTVVTKKIPPSYKRIKSVVAPFQSSVICSRHSDLLGKRKMTQGKKSRAEGQRKRVFFASYLSFARPI